MTSKADSMFAELRKMLAGADIPITQILAEKGTDMVWEAPEGLRDAGQVLRGTGVVMIQCAYLMDLAADVYDE